MDFEDVDLKDLDLKDVDFKDALRSSSRPFRPFAEELPLTAPTAVKQLAFDIQHQQRNNWCWAAVAASVSAFYSKTSPWTQCRIAAAEFVRPTCCSNDSDCDALWFLDRALHRTGNFVKRLGRLTFEQVRAEIDANLLVGVRVAWEGKGSHFVVIHGYAQLGTEEFLDVADPDRGELHLPFEEFADAYQEIGSWTLSYFTASATNMPLKLSTPDDTVLRAARTGGTLHNAKQLHAVASAQSAGGLGGQRSTVGLAHGVYVLTREALIEATPIPKYSRLRVYEAEHDTLCGYFDVGADDGRFKASSKSARYLAEFEQAFNLVLQTITNRREELELALLQVSPLHFEALWVRHAQQPNASLHEATLNEEFVVPLGDGRILERGSVVPYVQAIEALRIAAQAQARIDTQGT